MNPKQYSNTHISCSYFIEYIFITLYYKCAPQLYHLFQKVAGKKHKLAYAMEVQSQFVKIVETNYATS